ncbi:MAG TPA: hypothetical protein VG308_06610 [Stellaceae bacterium]|nr:hypothetical protein [Stellaceae bacterium]
MRRFWMILPAIVGLAACADGGPPPQLVPTPSVRAGFPPGGVADVIRVDTVDPLPLRVAELVAPDGTATPSRSLNVEANPRTIGGGSTIADPWRTSLLGANGNDPLPAGAVAAAYRSESQVLLTTSTADIALPDPVAYRRDWTTYRIRLSFGAPDNRLDVRELPAPQPAGELR